MANEASNNVSVLLNDGSGGFGAASNFPVGTNPTDITSADFNGDKKPDLAVANSNSSNVSVLLNDGSGGFGAATNFPVGAAPKASPARTLTATANPTWPWRILSQITSRCC